MGNSIFNIWLNQKTEVSGWTCFAIHFTAAVTKPNPIITGTTRNSDMMVEVGAGFDLNATAN